MTTFLKIRMVTITTIINIKSMIMIIAVTIPKTEKQTL